MYTAAQGKRLIPREYMCREGRNPGPVVDREVILHRGQGPECTLERSTVDRRGTFEVSLGVSQRQDWLLQRTVEAEPAKLGRHAH